MTAVVKKTVPEKKRTLRQKKIPMKTPSLTKTLLLTLEICQGLVGNHRNKRFRQVTMGIAKKEYP